MTNVWAWWCVLMCVFPLIWCIGEWLITRRRK